VVVAVVVLPLIRVVMDHHRETDKVVMDIPVHSVDHL
tara:strand:+ start:251 stop:361 length:111 start_codon:yes stop_codon:yes gene_type:complete